MKNQPGISLSIFIYTLALCFSLPASAQETQGKNMGKLNLSAFALKGFNLQYERQLTARMTLAIGYGNIPTSSIAFKSFIENQVDDPNVKVTDFRLGTSVFTPEVRFYAGKKGAFHGFYFAPYARFGTYKLQGPVEYVTSANTKRSAIFSGKLKTYTGGLLIGSSFQLSGRLYLDWWIVGASIGGGNGNFTATTQLSQTEQEALKDVLDNIDIPVTKIKSEVNSNGAIVSTTGTMAGIRGLGINLGIRF